MIIHTIIKKVKNSENTDDQCHLNSKKRSGLRLSSPPVRVERQLSIETLAMGRPVLPSMAFTS
jgi:hypothetical protein